MSGRRGTPSTTPPALPPLFFVAISVATVAIGAGIVGFVAPHLAPPLGHAPVALACLGVGFALEGWAISMLLAAARARQGRPKA